MYMTIYERFIPGQWLDNIDVNDFINLNKKPFFQEPIFLNTTQISFADIEQKFYLSLTEEEQQILTSFSFSMKNLQKIKKNPFLQEKYFHFILNFLGHSFGVTSKKMLSFFQETNYRSVEEIFQQVITSDLKKALKTNIFTNFSITPSFLHPDIRRVPLYGIDKLIEDRKYYLKMLEKHPQTTNWVEKRLLLHQEIKSLKNFEKFSSVFQLNSKKQIKNPKELMDSLFVSVLGCFLENRKQTFSLTEMIVFIDIFFEFFSQEQTLSEEYLQELMNEFCLRLFLLSTLYYVCEDKEDMLVFSDTICEDSIVKSSYRFLQSLLQFPIPFIKVHILWHTRLPEPFYQICEKVKEKDFTLLYIRNEKYKTGFVSPYGQISIPARDYIFNGGECDIEKILYLSLNGGKDIKENLNFPTVYQPLRTDALTFEEAMERFHMFLSFFMTMETEISNILLYANDINHQMFLRSALLHHSPIYLIQYRIKNINKVVELFNAIQQQQYKIIRNEKKWIVDIEPLSSDLIGKEEIKNRIVHIIYSELKRVKLYKNSNFTLTQTQE